MRIFRSVYAGTNLHEESTVDTPTIIKMIQDYATKTGEIQMEDAEGNQFVHSYDFSNLIDYSAYITTDAQRLIHPIAEVYVKRDVRSDRDTGRYYGRIALLVNSDQVEPNRGAYLYFGHDTPDRSPHIYWKRSDLDTSIPPVDRYFRIPPPETAEHFAERLQDELTHVARAGLEKLLTLNDIPLLLSQYSQYTTSSSSNPHNVSLRNGITGFKACVGYLQSQLNAGVNTQALEDAIQGLYGTFHTLYSRDASGAGIDFYNMCFDGGITDWASAYTARRVNLINADGTPGSLLKDVTAAHTAGGKVDTVAATAEYGGYATTDFETAYMHIDQNHGLAETLVIEEYVPGYRNVNLSTLKVWINDEASGTFRDFLEPFDPDRETHITAELWSGRDTIFIEAVAEHASAVITGAGLIDAHIGPNTINITVTSEDGEASKTYIIYTSRLR